MHIIMLHVYPIHPSFMHKFAYVYIVNNPLGYLLSSFATFCLSQVLLEDSVIEAQERLVKAHLRLYRRHITDLKNIHKYLKKAKGANLIPFPESSRANRNFSRSGKSGKRKNCICEELDPSEELPLGQSLQPYRRDRYGLVSWKHCNRMEEIGAVWLD